MSYLKTMAEQEMQNSNRLGAESYVKIGKNETVKIIPLVEFSEAIAFETHDFGEGKEFFSLPADMPEPGQPNTDPVLNCIPHAEAKGLKYAKSKKYIMPVLQWDEDKKEWSNPKYYVFKTTVRDGLTAAEIPLKGNDYEHGIKGAVIQIFRDDSTARTTYSVSWTGQHWLKKVGQGKDLPVSELDMLRGIIPFVYNDESEINDGIILKLQERGIWDAPVNTKEDDKWAETETTEA